MGILKVIFALIPFLREVLFNNQELNVMLEKNKSTVSLLIVNVFMLAITLYMTNELSRRDAKILELMNKENVLESKIIDLDDFFKRQLSEYNRIGEERLRMRDDENQRLKTQLDIYSKMRCTR